MDSIHEIYRTGTPCHGNSGPLWPGGMLSRPDERRENVHGAPKTSQFRVPSGRGLVDGV